MVFGRLKKTKQDDDAAMPGEQDGPSAVPAPEAGSAPDAGDRRRTGPFDESERDSVDGYIDLGALRIGATEGLQLRLEVEERSKRVIAVTLDLNGSNLQLQAFAAPRSEGVWDDIRTQIGLSVGSQGGTVEERTGVFGTELMAKLPAQTPEGQSGFRIARFIGVDGPRWFLRGVFGGVAATDAEAAKPLEDLFRSVVVIRGEHPLPPRELLPLRLPKDASASPVQPAGDTPAKPDLGRIERGPEITEIG